MKSNLITTINQIIKTLSNNRNLSSLTNKILIGKDNKDLLLELTKDQINTPIGNVLPLLNDNKSPLQDTSVDVNKLKRLVKVLSVPQSIIGFDHIGFCYKVDLVTEEKERLIKLMKQTDFCLYEEPSNDGGIWLFIGNIHQWRDPLIELIPIESTDDKWKNYWLPHVQIDINTNLTAEEIVIRVKFIYGKSVEPYLIKIGGIAYITRCRLGIINGVNINLDLATKSRDVEFLRKNIWERISA